MSEYKWGFLNGRKCLIFERIVDIVGLGYSGVWC